MTQLPCTRPWQTKNLMAMLLLFRILLQFQHVLIKVRHKQPILNNTIFFKFGLSFCLAISAVIFLHPEEPLCHLPSGIDPDALPSPPLSSEYDVPHDPLPNPDKRIQYAPVTAFPSPKDNSSQCSHHFLQSYLPVLLPKWLIHMWLISIGPLINQLRCCMSMNCIMHLVLNLCKELLCCFCCSVII